MSKGAKQAAAEVGGSAGVIKTSFAMIGGGAKGAWNSLGLFGKVALGVTAVATVAGVAWKAYQAYQQRQEELRVSAAQSIGAWRESYDGLNAQIDTITSLRNALDSNTLSEQEAYNAKSQLYNIQQSLAEQYGAQANGLNLINGELQTQIGLINGITQAEAQRMLLQNRGEISKATNAMESVKRYELGAIYDSENYDAALGTQSIRNVLQKYGDVVKSEMINMGNGILGETFYIEANADEVYDVINDISAAIQNIENETGKTILTDRFLNTLSNSVNNSKEVLDKYGEMYKQAKAAQILTDPNSYTGNDGTSKKAIDWMNDYTNAVQNYNDALASGDPSKIAEAASAFESVDSSVQTLLNDRDGLGQYSSIFNEIGDQLNRNQIRRNNLTNGLQNARGQLKNDLDYLKGLKDSGLTDMDLLGAYSKNGNGALNGDVSAALERIIVNARDLDLITGNTEEEVQSLVGALVSLGIVTGASSNALASETQTVDSMRDSVAKAIDTQNNLTAALAAGNSATGMTAEQVKNVVDAFKDVEGFNIAELFENTATGVQMSADAFKRLNKNLQFKEQAKLLDAITAKMQEYNDALTSGDESRIASATEDLIMLQAMLDEYNAATSKYNAYVTATSSANARDSYANVAAGYASVGQLIKDGWVTDDSVISYMELVLGDNWNADGALTAAEAYAKLGETIDGTSSSLKDYLATDSKGNLTSKGVWQFAEDVFSKFKDDSRGIASMADDGTLKLNLTGERLQAVAEAFGTTTDMVMLFGQALSNAGMNVEFGSLSDQIGNINKQIEQTKKEIEAAQKIEDWDAVSAGTQKLNSELKQRVRTGIQSALEDSNVSLSDMLDMGDADLAKALGLDTLGLGENLGQYLDYARQQLQSLGQSTGEIPLNVKIDEGQFNSMIAALVGEPVEIPAEATVGDINTDGLGDKDVEIPANVVPTMNNMDLASTAGDGANATGTIDYQAGTMPTEAPPIPGIVNYTGDFSGIVAPTISGTAVYNVVFQGGGIGGGFFGGGKTADAAGTMVSVAHADGTAYNALNYTRLTPSHAGGQVALPSDEYALTNEVG